MTQEKIKNPFLHQHDDHDHDHHHHDHDDGEDLTQLDPAQQSLADALRVSFMVLKVLMVVLLLFYIGSGTFRVSEQEEAVRLRFGGIVGTYEDGLHFGLPFPIEQVIHVPVSERTLQINQAYRPEIDEEQEAMAEMMDQTLPARPLNPERDGSLVTADANIVHGRVTISYRVWDTQAFVENVGVEPGATLAERLQAADELIRNVAEESIVYTVAQSEADAVIRMFPEETAMTRMQQILTNLGTGLEVTRISMTDRQMPRAVEDAYERVLSAESERAQLIDGARQEAAQMLSETAGAGYEPLVGLIQAYEQAQTAGQADEAQELEAQLNQVLGELQLPEELGGMPISGQVAQRIDAARTERTTLVEQIRSEAATFENLLEQYQGNPRLVMSRLWQAAKEDIFTGEVETFYSMGGQFYPVISRDERIQRRRQEEQLRAEEEQRLEQQRQLRQQQQRGGVR